MYRVMVDENEHFMDDDARWTLGRFESLEDAEAACRRLVDASLSEHFQPGMSAKALFNSYVSYGDDPFIIAEQGPAPSFSARGYAQDRAVAMCGPQSFGAAMESRDKFQPPRG